MDANKILYDLFYVVIMKRWGAEDTHHYLMGVYDKLSLAKEAAVQERESRSGKYEYVIEAYSLNNRICLHNKINTIARSDGMAALTDDERKESNKIKEYKDDIIFNEYSKKLAENTLKEEHTQLNTEVFLLREENEQLRRKLNERKTV